MLTVTRLADKRGALLVKLSGEFRGGWVEVVRAACVGASHANIVVDVSGVSHADPTAADLVRSLSAQGVRFSGDLPLG